MKMPIVMLAVGDQKNIYPKQTYLARYGSGLLVMTALNPDGDKDASSHYNRMSEFRQNGMPVTLFVITQIEGEDDFVEVIPQAIILAINKYYPMSDKPSSIEVIFKQIA